MKKLCNADIDYLDIRYLYNILFSTEQTFRLAKFKHNQEICGSKVESSTS